MKLHSCTQTPGTLSFLCHSYSIEVKWENGWGAWGRQMHPNLSAAVIELCLFAVLVQGLPSIFYSDPVDPLFNHVDEIVTIEVRQKLMKRKFWTVVRNVDVNKFFFFLSFKAQSRIHFFPVVWKSLWNVGCNLMINWFVSPRQTNDSLVNQHEKKPVQRREKWS